MTFMASLLTDDWEIVDRFGTVATMRSAKKKTSPSGFEEGFKPLHGVESTGILVPMLLVESDAQAARQQLERVLRSPGFARNERLSRFLRFVVERHLEGRDHELKESVIAVEVFGRRP